MITGGFVRRLLRYSVATAYIIMSSAAAHAQCPLQLTEVRPNVKQSWSRVGRAATMSKAEAAAMLPDFQVKVRNVSGKPIRGLKMQAAYYDATEDLHPIPIAWNSQKRMRPGDEAILRWENPYYQSAFVGWLVAPIKILFEDGTTWEAAKESLDPCYGEYWRDKKHPRLTSLPEELLTASEKLQSH